LASQGITADTWQQWISEDNAKREQLVREFSEFIFFSILDKTGFLIRELPKNIQYVRVNENAFDLLWFKEDNNTVGQARAGKSTEKDDEIPWEVFTGKKIFRAPKKAEIFSLLSEGYRPVKSDELTHVSQLFEVYKDMF
jgi:hypothetical protein